MLYFITGNKNKLTEVQAVLPEVEQLDIDLPEIQDLDPHIIIKAKLHEAFKHVQGEFIVEDTSLYFDGLNGLPGPLIKWFLKSLDYDGLADLASRLDTQNATAKTLIGYAKNEDEIFFFEGVVKGKVVVPQGESRFGWDSVFMPEGHDRTFAQMSLEEKNELSMRRMAVQKLKDFLAENKQGK